jgi:carbon storage regulator
MLVLSREAGSSVIIESSEETILVTILRLIPERQAISALLNRASLDKPGQLESQTVDLVCEARIRIGENTDVTLVDFRADKARIGINVPRGTSVHRSEVYEALRRGNRRTEDGGDTDDGPAGAKVPRPRPPSPPALDVRLDQPPPADEGGE